MAENDNINNDGINFDDIELIANYIDGNIIDNDKKEELTKKLETNPEFRRHYTEAFEHIKNINKKELYKTPEKLLERLKTKSKKKLIFEIMKSAVKLILNTIENIKPKEIVVEYLSSEENKLISQKFSLGKALIEIKTLDGNNANVIIEPGENISLILKNIENNTVIIDLEDIGETVTLKDIEKGQYQLTIGKEKVEFELK
jgi:transcriptional regulator of heat shock response